MSSERLRMLAALLEMESDFLEECARCGAIRPEDLPGSPGEAPPSELARLRRLRRICRGLDIDVYAGSIIVDLLERMEELQRELERRAGTGL
jgi:chaperone modulatory protein CbpM